MKKILRIGTYPTNEHSSVGLHAFKISNLQNYYTYYLFPVINGTPLAPLKNCKIIPIQIFYSAKPVNANWLIKLKHQFLRTMGLFYLTLKGMRIIQKEKIDIIHIHSPMYLLVALISHLLGKKTFITYHGTEFYRIKNSKIYSLTARFFDVVFCLSSTMKNPLENIHKSPVKIMPNGIDIKEYPLINQNRKKQILAVGTLKKEKGFDILIKAFSRVVQNKEFKDYQLVIVGDGKLRMELEKCAQKEKISSKVAFIGHRNKNELIELYNTSEIFVLSSISEGFPKVILEAISCGCRIVSTQVGEVPNIVGKDYPFLAKPSDLNSLYSSLLEALKNPNEQLLKRTEIINQYSWDSTKNHYTKIYDQAIVGV